jgi:hypothetical protein
VHSTSGHRVRYGGARLLARFDRGERGKKGIWPAGRREERKEVRRLGHKGEREIGRG